jgi:serine/threonine protein kinase
MQTSAAAAAGSAAYAYAADDEELAPGSFAGEYQIEKKIGEGGMGAVYGARHPLIGKRAAIKVIRRDLSSSHEAVDRFIREAQSVNQIGDPNIVDVFGFGRLPDGRSFFVMEWLQGESLRERLQRPLPFPEAIEILETIAKALQAAHEAGVVHRDLKPDNVFLASHKGSKPEVKLLDFGLAKLSGSQDGGMNHTRTGVVMGTPLYLSPEQAKGVKVDMATDIYSLGAMAYEMCAGTVPFKADSAVEIMAMHISRPALPLQQIAPWIPIELDRLVLGMLEKNPPQRPTIGQIREALAACRTQATHNVSKPTMMMQGPAWTPPPSLPSAMQHTPTPAAPSGMASSPPKSGNRMVVIIVAVLAVAGVGIGAVLALNGGKKAGAGSGSEVAVVEPVKPDPVKVDPPKVEPAKVESAKVEPANVEPAKVETVKDPAKVEAAKVETVKDPANVETVKDPAKIEPVKAKVGAVAITLDTKSTVSIDGKVVGRGTDRVVIELSPGDHRIHAEAPRRKPVDTTVHIEVGGKQTVRLSLPKNERSTVNSVPDPFAD